MNDDPRCCGSGTCIIDTEGRCWCGQQWNGSRMAAAPLAPCAAATPEGAKSPTDDADAHP